MNPSDDHLPSHGITMGSVSPAIIIASPPTIPDFKVGSCGGTALCRRNSSHAFDLFDTLSRPGVKGNESFDLYKFSKHLSFSPNPEMVSNDQQLHHYLSHLTPCPH